jgi:type II secretory pathway pseudopilin PulG
MRSKLMGRQEGFTILELLVLIVCMIILLALLLIFRKSL